MRYYHPTPTRLEKFPKISAAFLAREGLLTEAGTAVGAYISHYEPFLVMRSSVNKVWIQTIHADQPVLQEVNARYMPCGATSKPVFVCPVLERFCEEIVLINGLWASRAGHGLPVRNGTTAQRKMEAQLRFRKEFLKAHCEKGVRESTKTELRNYLTSYITKDGLLPDAWRVLEPLCHVAAEKARKQHRNSFRSRHPAELGTEAAIKRGASAAGSLELRIHLATRPTNTVQAKVAAVKGATRPWLAQEKQFCLDLAPLRSRGWLEADQMSAWILDRTDAGYATDRILLVIDRTGEQGYVALEFFDPTGERRATQMLKLIVRPTMRDRLFLECPIQQTAHDCLFLRDGFFASAKAQRLKTYSQLPRA